MEAGLSRTRLVRKPLLADVARTPDKDEIQDPLNEKPNSDLSLHLVVKHVARAEQTSRGKEVGGYMHCLRHFSG